MFGSVSLFIIITTVIISIRGFNNYAFLEAGCFNVDRILVQKQYRRLILSGFLHSGWTHLILNMLSLYFFSSGVELVLGGGYFLVIYFAGLLGGNLLSLLIHKNHGEYTAVGASGAVCGIIFASIALFPGMNIGFFGLPLPIPAWIYGLGFVLFSIYGIRSNRDNIGHDAHLGGALIGMLVAIMMRPDSLRENLPTILIISIPCILFIFLIVKNPHLLLVDSFFSKNREEKLTVDQRFNLGKAERQREIDRILDKIHRKGINSLTKKEKDLLDKYSNSQ